MRCGGQCFPARLEDLGGKRQSRLAGFTTQAPCMGVVGVFERPFALDERLGFRLRTNEPKLGRRELLAGDEMAHADFVDRFLLARFLGFAQHFEHLFVLAHQALFVN